MTALAKKSKHSGDPHHSVPEKMLMKRILFTALTALTALYGCKKDHEAELMPDGMVIQATIENSAPVKTVMDIENHVLWSEDDQIVAFMQAPYGQKYQVQPEFAGKSYADFSMVPSVNESNLPAENQWEHNVAYYTYSESVECIKSGDDYVLEVELPSEQAYAPESFGEGSMAMAAISTNNRLSFKNLLGGIKLQLKGTQTIASITLEGNNNERLSGAADITVYTDGTVPAITMTDHASASITLDCSPGIRLNENTVKDFIIVLPPVFFKKGFTVTVRDTDEKTYTFGTDKANAVLRSSLHTMPPVMIDNSQNDDHITDEKSRKVMLLYSAAYNSLRDYLLDDIDELKQGWLPGNNSTDDILLVYTHTPTKYGAYNDPTSPYLIRLYKDSKGNTISDTLVTYPKGTISSSARQLNDVLSYVKDNFVADSYGMVFSSHATGYLPAGYYRNPDKYVFSGSVKMRAIGTPAPVPYIEPDLDPSLPMVKSIGQDQAGSSYNMISYEMELADFAEAIPMKLDYILFDACFMGGVEVAYELRDKCRKAGFSQAEVLAEGMNYKTITEHLLSNDQPYPEGACSDYFKQYDILSGVYRSATISLVDCENMEPLAEVCRNIFSKHREGLARIIPSDVQRYYRKSNHWFYDLESIILEAGASKEEVAELHDALNQCVLYKGHTPKFMDDFDISVFSGFSMYLPCDGSTELDKYYKTLQWNIASGLVE